MQTAWGAVAWLCRSVLWLSLRVLFFLRRHIRTILFALCVCLLWSVAVVAFFLMALADAFSGDRHHPHWVAVTILGAPAVAVVTTVLALVNRRLRWLWVSAGLVLVVATPLFAVHMVHRK